MSFNRNNESEVTATSNPTPTLLDASLTALFSFIWKSTVACYFYFIGYRQWSLIWIAVPIVGSLVMDTLSFNITRKINQRKLRSVIDEKELVYAHFKELPAWVFFPDVERVEWCNKILRQIWPTMNNFTRNFLQNIMEPQLKATMETYMLKGFHFQTIDLGSISPKITGVKVYDRTGHNEIIMDLYIFYGGDCEIIFGASGLTAGIKDFQIEGTMRFVMKPLIPNLPIIGGIKYFFVDNPDIDFSLTGVTGLLDIPGIRSQVREVLQSVVSSMIVLPNMCVVNLTDVTEIISYLMTPEPIGVIRVNVLEGKNLIPQDLNGLSDPFVIIWLGAQQIKTQTIQNSLQPIWQFYGEFIVMAEGLGQKLVFQVWDEDYGKNDPMGNATYDISAVKGNKYIDTWLTLEEVAHGSIHVELTWFNLTPSIQHLNDTLDDNNMFEDAPLNSAVLVVFLESANELPTKYGPPNTVANLKVGTDSKTTQEYSKSANPKWSEGFCFLVRDPQSSTLELKVIDSVYNKLVGQMEFKIQVLLERRHMKMAKQPFKLLKSGAQSEIIMSLSLQIMTIDDVTVSQIICYFRVWQIFYLWLSGPSFVISNTGPEIFGTGSIYRPIPFYVAYHVG